MASVIDRAKTQLIIQHPFFASILLRRPLTATTKIPTAAIDKAGRIYYNPDWVNDMPVNQVVFLLAHECMHWIMATFSREGGRNPRGWNYATDAVNNELLIEAGVGEFIEGGVRWPNAQNLTAEAVYELLPKGGDGQPGSGLDIGGPGDDLDHSGDSLTPTEARELEAQIKVELAQARDAAKQMGNMPGNISRLVDELLFPKTPWYVILERFMTERIKNDYSWSKPNRRHIANELYLPSLNGQGMGEVAIIIDTSGSIGERELAYFAGHVNVILETCRPVATRVIYVDTQVQHVETFAADQLPITLAAHGGGGTDMREGTNWVDTNMPDAACMILLTDGYTPWPDYVGVPLLVASTSQESPIGENVKLEME